MTLDNFVAGIEAEWEPDVGFFWSIRQGIFRKDEFERTLARLATLPSVSQEALPARFVSVLWYIPIFMQWQLERVSERGGNLSEYGVAMNKLTAEVERILGTP